MEATLNKFQPHKYLPVISCQFGYCEKGPLYLLYCRIKDVCEESEFRMESFFAALSVFEVM